MRRITCIALSALMSLSLAGLATAEPGAQAKTADKTTAAKAEAAANMTAQGEIVDLGCYLGHGAKGPEHKACAAKCINGGMPMGLLAKDGTLYLLTMSHDNADPFNSAKQMAAEHVKITGPMHESNGMKSIEVLSVEAIGKSAAKS